MGDRRTGADSRCCNEGGAPYRWRHYEDGAHAEVEELGEWLLTLAPFARAHQQGEINGLFAAAAAGKLTDSGDERTPIKPVRRDPEIYELRKTALSKKLRFYHGEPSESPASLVALHRHIKVGSREQQGSIEFAAERYNAGRSSNWA